MKFKINGTQYWIDEFVDGYAWVSEDDEATVSFKTTYEAYCNAWDFERMKGFDREKELSDILEAEMFGYNQINKNNPLLLQSI